MPIPYRYDDKTKIPKEQEPFYVEKTEGGKTFYLLDCTEVVPEAKLEEFRTNNRNFHAQIRDFETKYKDVDPEEYRKLKTAVAGLSNDELAKVLKDGKKVEEVVAERTKSMREDHDRSLSALRKDRDDLKGRLEHYAINQAVVTDATKLGLRSTAILDITARAREVFKLDEKTGRPLAMDGEKIIYGKDGNPMTIAEWCEKQVAEAPHLFESSKGGGAGDGRGGQGGNGSEAAGSKGKNPWKPESLNRTEQMKIVRENKALAKKLMLEAGKQIPVGW